MRWWEGGEVKGRGEVGRERGEVLGGGEVVGGGCSGGRG